MKNIVTNLIPTVRHVIAVTPRLLTVLRHKVKRFTRIVPPRVMLVFTCVFCVTFGFLSTRAAIRANKTNKALAAYNTAVATQKDSLQGLLLEKHITLDSLAREVEERKDEVKRAEGAAKELRRQLENMKAAMVFSSSKAFPSRGAAVGKGRKVLHFSYGYEIHSRLNNKQFREYMIRKGFKGAARMNMDDLKRLYLCYTYDSFFWDMHKKTGLPVSVIFAYFIIEATNKGKESQLLRNHGNPGGIKYREGRGTKKVMFHDDCFDKRGRRIKCGFAKIESYEKTVELWASVFNSPRYKPCKSKRNTLEICKCLKKAGYHTSPNFKGRAKVADEYYKLRALYPK